MQSLIDDVINAVNTILYRAIDAIESGLLSLPPSQLGFAPSKDTTGSSRTKSKGPASPPTSASHPPALTEIENGVHSLETLLQATVDKTFDKFEIYTLRNILTVPEDLAPWMRLGHYEGLRLPLEKGGPTPETVMELRRQVLETRKLNRGLKVVKGRNEVLLEHLKGLLLSPGQQASAGRADDNIENAAPSLAFLTSNPSPTNLTANAQFTASQLPALREALQRLRPLLHLTPEEALKNAERQDHSSSREERRGYIEGRVRGVVQRERVGGGEGFEGGAVVGEEEVRGLEGLVDKMEE